MGDPVAANQTATAAADEAGAGSADSIAVTCDLIRFGVFFDGTGNSRDHAGTGDVSWHTNVDLLEHRYEKLDAPEQREVNGQTRNVNIGSIYARGIGVEAGGGTTTNGMARGMGDEGVRQRVADTVNEVRTEIRSKARGMEVCDVWFDTFGFSRGAAAARHFANEVPRQNLTVQDAEAEVKFMGLFDTVVMIGNSTTTDGTYDNVRVETRGTAERIVHITADDEIREKFPLTRAIGERRIRMVGVHSDIGGGYNPTRRGDQRGSFEFEHEDYSGLPGYLRRNWGLTTSNGTGADSTSPDTLVSERQSRWQPHDAGEWYSTFNWSCQHGLQFVSLKLMYDEAVAADVPFLPWTNTIEGTDVTMDPMLQTYYGSIKSGSVTTEQKMEVRLRYSHVSFNGERNWGFRPHLPRESGRRDAGTIR